MSGSTELTGRIAVVTGAGSGFGAAMAHEFGPRDAGQLAYDV